MAVDRNYILDKMRGRIMKPQDFDYDMLSAPPLYSLLSQDDISRLHKIATSIRYQAKPIERLKMIDDIMKSRGFVKFAGGTNRVVYRYLEDDSFVVKVASDAVGMGDNPREFVNQFIYKPFVTKVFEVSQCGTVGLFERVLPITSREEFMSIANDVYDVITNWFIGEYIMDDIGTDYFMNWALRKGFGPVLLDFPYSYKLDGNKLYCNRVLPDGNVCGGVIDYDDGFNHLVCTKCNKRYFATDLKKAVSDGQVVRKGGRSKMKVAVGYGDNTIDVKDSVDIDVTPHYESRKGRRKHVKTGELKVAIRRGRSIVNRSDNYESDEEFHSNLKIQTSGGRGTVVNTVAEDVIEEQEPEVNVEPEDVVDTVEESEQFVEAVPDDNSTEYMTFCAKVISSVDIDGKEEGKFKCYVVTDEEGTPIRIGGNNGPQMVIAAIDGTYVNDLSLVESEALEVLYVKIKDGNKKIKELSDKNAELTKYVNGVNKDLLTAQKKYDELYKEFEEFKSTVEDIPDEEVSEDRSDPVSVPAAEEEPEYKATSPLIKNADEEGTVEVDDDVPVGAAPPKAITKKATTKKTSTKSTTSKSSTTKKSTTKKTTKSEK